MSVFRLLTLISSVAVMILTITGCSSVNSNEVITLDEMSDLSDEANRDIVDSTTVPEALSGTVGKESMIVSSDL